MIKKLKCLSESGLWIVACKYLNHYYPRFWCLSNFLTNQFLFFQTCSSSSSCLSLISSVSCFIRVRSFFSNSSFAINCKTNKGCLQWWTCWNLFPKHAVRRDRDALGCRRLAPFPQHHHHLEQHIFTEKFKRLMLTCTLAAFSPSPSSCSCSQVFLPL